MTNPQNKFAGSRFTLESYVAIGSLSDFKKRAWSIDLPWIFAKPPFQSDDNELFLTITGLLEKNYEAEAEDIEPYDNF